MSTTQTAYRLPDELIARIDRHVERMRAAAPGCRVARSDAVRSLLIAALDVAEAAAGDASKGKRGRS